MPMRIHGLDEFYLLAAAPAFNFLFAIDRCVRIEEALVVRQTSQVVPASESLYDFVLVPQRRVRLPVIPVYTCSRGKLYNSLENGYAERLCTASSNGAFVPADSDPPSSSPALLSLRFHITK